MARAKRVTERHLYTINSDEHGAKHDERSKKEQLPARSGTTKPVASVNQDQEEKTRGMVRVQRSGGAPDLREERTEMERSEHVAPILYVKFLWSLLSCDEVLTGGRNHTGQGSRVAGGGGPG